VVGVVGIPAVVLVDDAGAGEDVLEELSDVEEAGDEHLIVAERLMHVARAGDDQQMMPQQPKRVAAHRVVRHVPHVGRLTRGRDELDEPRRRLDCNVGHVDDRGSQ
jgi:hypothetical protein